MKQEDSDFALSSFRNNAKNYSRREEFGEELTLIRSFKPSSDRDLKARKLVTKHYEFIKENSMFICLCNAVGDWDNNFNILYKAYLEIIKDK